MWLNTRGEGNRKCSDLLKSGVAFNSGGIHDTVGDFVLDVFRNIVFIRGGHNGFMQECRRPGVVVHFHLPRIIGAPEVISGSVEIRKGAVFVAVLVVCQCPVNMSH